MNNFFITLSKILNKRKPVYRVDILEYALKHNHQTGLCRAIKSAFRIFGIYIFRSNLTSYFPLFTRQQAMRFGASRNAYWWPEGEWRKTGREEFLLWLIKQYKHDTENLRDLCV